MLIFDINIKNRIKYVLVDERGGVRRGRLLSPAACAAAARRRGGGAGAARTRRGGARYSTARTSMRAALRLKLLRITKAWY